MKTIFGETLQYSKFCSEFILPGKNIKLICIRSTNSFLIKHTYCLCGSVENKWKYKHALIFALYFYSRLLKNRFWTNILFDNIIFLFDIRPRIQFDWIWSVRLQLKRAKNLYLNYSFAARVYVCQYHSKKLKLHIMKRTCYMSR